MTPQVATRVTVRRLSALDSAMCADRVSARKTGTLRFTAVSSRRIVSTSRCASPAVLATTVMRAT